MENSENEPKECQIGSLPHVFDGYGEVPPESLLRKLRLLLRRNLNSRQVKLIRAKLRPITNQITSSFQRKQAPAAAGSQEYPSPQIFQKDLVRVRSIEEIKATLNIWGQLKGCMFMPEMAPFCGSTQIVFKRLERFVDERDYHLKSSHGIILLEGVHCQGTSDYGRCDRSCFYFWREEWLEKIEPGRSEAVLG
jgi:hypothetical protein